MAQYLYKNMNYPDRAITARAMGDVIIGFEVDIEGKIENAEIHKSVEFSVDQEGLRLIKKSPKWTPGKQDGRLVRTYKKQPMVFRLN